ncbi:MAG: erythromycin esterase family protein [Bacteroidia bacterium]
MKNIVLVLILLTLKTITYGQECLANLKDYSSPFDKIEASSFTFLKDKLEEVRIVGLGEDTHGTSEFTKLPKELLQYLVENHNFNLFIIEAGFGEVAFLNDYIQGDSDSLLNILKTRISTWRYQTTEFVEMMEWLRAYNKTHIHKVTLYGMEMQYVTQDLNRVNQYLKKVGIENMETAFTKHLWQPMTDEEKGDYYNTYKKLKNLFDKNKEQYIEKTDENSYAEAYHHLEVIGQFVSAIHQNSELLKSTFRDIYMAENVEWILQNNPSNSKAFIWAHNVHLGDWVSNGIIDVLGHQLKKRFGESFYNIATDFGTGDFYAFPHNANEVGWKMQVYTFEKVVANTFTACLQQLGSPNVFLDVKKIKTNSSMKCEIEKDLTIMYGAGSQEWGTQTETVPIGKAFDAIIYLDKTHKINFLR